MTRGEVWQVEFGAALGSEVRKTRPAVIVSNDAANRHLAPLSKPDMLAVENAIKVHLALPR